MEIKGESKSIGSAIDNVRGGFNSSKGTSGFDDLLTTMSTRSSDKNNRYKTDTRVSKEKNYEVNPSTTTKVTNTTNNYDNKKINSNKNVDNVNTEEKVSNKENENTKATDKENNIENQEVQSKEVGKEEKLSKEDKSLEEKEAIENLSKILGISNEVLIKAMEELDLTILDLENGENLVNLLVEINGLTEPVELLNLENFTEQVSQIKELVSEVKEKGKIDLTVLENLEKSEAIDDIEMSEIVKTLEEINTAISNESQENLSEGENQQDDTSQEETLPPITSIRNSDEITPNIVPGQVNELDDIIVDDTIISDGSTINDIPKIDSFVNQVGREISSRNVNTADVVKQLVEAMKVEVKADTTSEIKIMLRPQHLGDVTLKIATDNGIVVAQFVAESERVKAIIESNFNTLRDNLLQQGVDVGQLEVTVRDDSNNSSNDTGYTSSNGGNGGIDGLDTENIEVNTSDADKKQVLGSTVDYSA